MTTDRVALTRAAWAYPVFGLVMAVTFLLAGDSLRPVIAGVAMLSVIPAGFVALRVHRFPRPFIFALIGVGVLYVLEAIAAEFVTVGIEVELEDAIDLIATALIIGLVTFIVGQQRGGFRPGDGVDGIIIGVGAWIVAWVYLVQPFLNSGTQSTLALALNALYLPTTVVLLALSAVMLAGGGRPPASKLLLAFGLLCNVGGDVLYALDDIRDLGQWSYTGADFLYTLSVTACAGAFVHPTAPALIGISPNRRHFALPGRVTVLVAALAAPVLVTALSSSVSTLDRVVRAISVLALLALTGVRLIAATRAQLQSQHLLEDSVRTDDVTGLPNKRAVLEITDAVVSDRWRSAALPAMYLFDLDGFKNINDSFGHATGDEVLCVIARRLVAAADAIGATAARVSGDEFVVFDATPQSSQEALDNARAVHLAFQQSLTTTSGELFVKASCGVATMEPGAPTTSDDLFRWADIAMYRAKSAGRNRVVLYEATMQDRVSSRMDIENALHGALARNELHLYHQPIIEIGTGRVTGFEALLRWRRPDGTIVSPNEFIPIAEETGMIDAIGEWAMSEATRQLRFWIDEGIVPDDTAVSVNVSPRQLADPRFAAVVNHVVENSGLPAHLLWLEVTESVMIDNPEVAQSALQAIRATGVRIALDDFGTGYSSLSLLQKFPIQRIKIDRAFINSIVDNLNDRMLVRTIVGLGQSMGIDVVAEGVDSMLQLRLLRELGCAKAQGFLISQPAPAEAMRSTIGALDSLTEWPDFSEMVGD